MQEGSDRMPEVDDAMCFACGEENPISLGLKFKKTSADIVEAKFTALKNHQGYNGIMHGGLVATLLDEAMAYAVGIKGITAYTAELNVRFKKALKIGEKVIIMGEYEKSLKRTIAVIHYCSAQILDSSDKLIAKAEAKFVEKT
ncbi:PaaI family thioesterase [Halanaerobium hydrogeniformans]|uniref:Acyl-coenzyme A thioesterase THEM4 n=1 Tax=Halanaerobium hydrogeniformans TaxID=656519 RepID=E4RN86_HALHG|nr:PaaI family thioesterase [Halanaerobium hydrogeniformans]ADQ14303.1 thioesterase superfamily protein [Halanaerobium hydrogeniformans]